MKMKKRILFLFFFLSLFLFGCGKKEMTDALRFKNEYEALNGEKYYDKEVRKLEIDEDNLISYVSVEELTKMIEGKQSFVLYLGFPECPWCRSVIPTLFQVARDLGIDAIYYINIKEMRDSYQLDDSGNAVLEKKGSKDYQKLLALFDAVLDDYTLTTENGEKVNVLEKRIYAPSIISVVDGKPQEKTDGISDQQTDAYMDLSYSIQKEMYDKIKCSIQCVASASKKCMPKSC